MLTAFLVSFYSRVNSVCLVFLSLCYYQDLWPVRTSIPPFRNLVAVIQQEAVDEYQTSYSFVRDLYFSRQNLTLFIHRAQSLITHTEQALV